MVTRSARALAVAFALCALGTAAAASQTLQRLTVTAFSLSSDVARPQTERPFHVIVAIHVNQRIARLDDVQLPVFFGVEELGDERHLVSGAKGTDYREVLTLVAHHAGTLRFSPATLDAIDARDGVAKRYISNSLTLVAGSGALDGASALPLAWTLLGIVVVALLATLAALAARSLRRTHAVRTAPPLAPPITPAVARSPRDRAREALRELRARSDRPHALLFRRALRSVANSPEGETLSQALLRPATHDPALRNALRAAERAAFCTHQDFPHALHEVLATGNSYLNDHAGHR